MRLSRDSLDSLLAPDSFAWLAGIEDTFITAPSPRTGRTLDEYELTGHYAQLEADLDLFAALGLRQVRYGLPWHRLNPRPGHWDFDWADRAIDGLLARGIDPVVDLVHYGLPAWIDGAFLHPDYPEYVAEYAGRVAERYRGRVHAYTPLNEPRVTAWYCGRLGWWPPFQRSWRGFVRVLLAACRGIAATVARLHAVDPRIVAVHVDATDLYASDEPALAPEVERRQHLVFLALDLLAGRVRADHPLFGWLLQQGAMPDELDAFVAARAEPDLVGINLYPLFSDKRLLTRGGRLRIRMPYASADIVERLAALYWARCRRPLLISETASSGSVARRLQWLEDSVRATARVRARGIPLVGYTWWPLFALVTWGYREGRLPPARYLRQMGLWDLAPGAVVRANASAGASPDADASTAAGELRRVATPLVARYRELVEGGAREVGRLASPGAPSPPRSPEVP